MRVRERFCAKQLKTRLLAMTVCEVTYLYNASFWSRVVTFQLLQRQADILFHAWEKFANIHSKLKMLVLI